HVRGVHRHLRVSHAVARRYPVTIAQHFGQHGGAAQLGRIDVRFELTTGGLSLEGNAQETVVQVDVGPSVVGPDRMSRMVRRVALPDHPEYASKAIDHEVVAAVALDILEKGLANPLQCAILAGLEWRLQSFRCMKYDS